MKILFCSQFNLTKTLGMPKTLLELAEELEKFGWTCKVIGPLEICANNNLKNYNQYLREYLKKHAKEYDVIEYDYKHLPYPRSEFPKKTLFVARVQLLHVHMEYIKFPIIKTWRHIIGYLLKNKICEKKLKKIINTGYETLKESDLIIVLNHNDKNKLINIGLSRNNIRVLSNGLSKKMRLLFNKVSSKPPENSTIAFVGTFDFRKGGADFPKIVKNIIKDIPNINFKLLGTKGMYQTKKDVLTKFPRKLRRYIEIIPQFKPEELPNLLSDCSVGIYPSYLEGMPLGILEMLATSVPVIAYNCPGPGMMLPKEYLVPRGDTKAMSEKVVALLKDKQKLYAARKWAKKRSRDFNWEDIAKKTSNIYLEKLYEKKIIKSRVLEK
jgi:glycosyltransferase involved in cell wall biosynthesis